MRRLFTLDAQNYAPDIPVIYRVSVRGIIFRRGEMVLVHTRRGETRLPGGGVEAGESEKDALVREILEETGRHVIPGSIREFGEVEEKRRSLYEESLWHHMNRLYICSVDEREDAPSYTEGEMENGCRPIWLTPERALYMNEEMLSREGVKPHNTRDYAILKYIKEAGITV